MIKKYFEISNGEKIYYLDEGKKEKVIVLIHGNMSSGIHFKPLIEKFKKEYRVIAPDLRGFGDSSYINPINSIEDFSNDVIDLLDILKIKEYDLVGWSTGGAISMKIASKRQKQVKKLVLIESCSYRGYPIYKKNIDGSPRFGEYYSTKEELAEDVIQVIPMNNIYKKNDIELMNTTWKHFIYSVNQPNEEDNYIYLNETMKQRNLVDVYWALTSFNMSNFSNGVSLGDGTIKDVICPVLSFWGDKDLVVLEYMVDEIIEAIPGSIKITLKDSGHSPLIDSPEVLESKIIEFLK